MKDYKIFVINISEKRWKKYENDKRYRRFQGCHGKLTLNINRVNEFYHFRYNAKDDHRLNVAGCSYSHLWLMNYIYDNKINNAIIIEDDALIDFDRLNELDEVKGFCYIGGWMRSPTLTKPEGFVKPHFERGIHRVDPEKFVINNCHGYYFESYEDVKEWKTRKYEKKRSIDGEFVYKQKNKKNVQFIYPAISTLFMPDAEEGFTWGKGCLLYTSDAADE